MIPIRLALRNFMCYRNQMEPLSFEGFHIACLCGDNGSGKSALLDAITWALWGKSRAKSHDELVHQGESEMEVEFEFAMGEQRYRVIRKRARPQPRRQGLSVLELQAARGDGFISLTGDSLEETQHHISEILRMDYQTFVNSSLLLQGRADSFTVNDPRERKEVLSRILGLSLYDELEEKAKEIAKKQESRCQEHASSIKVIDMELLHRPKYEAELAQLAPELERLEGQVATQETAVSSLRRERDSLEVKRQQLAEAEAQIKKTEGELSYWKGQVSAHQARVERYEAVLGRRPEIEAGQRRLAELKQASQAFDEKFKRLFALQQRGSQLETAIEKARGQLVTEQSLLQARIKERELKSASLPHLRGEMEQSRLRLAELDKVEAAIKSQKEESLKTLTQLHRLESEQAQLASELKGLQERLALLAQEGARCPLCETDLGTDGRQRLVARLQAEVQDKAEAQRSAQVNAQHAKQLYQKLEKESGQLEKRLSEERRTRERHIAGLEKDIAHAEQAAAELPAEQARLALLEQRLAQKKFAEAEQTALQAIEQEVAGLGYDAEEHRRVQGALKEFEHYQLLGRQLEEAEQSIAAERAALAQAEAGVDQGQQLLKELAQHKQTLAAELAALPQIAQRLREAEALCQELKGQRQSCLDRLNAAKQSLRHCQELEALKHKEQNLLQEAAKEQEIYEELAKAFGKKGIQALLIEAALPEIEAEANRLLGRMTDNRMHLKLETQRQTKQGKPVETLDIMISDELGTRDYEMFSGGEAFRINFALRIALAKLLARRAGAPLPTLVIDEGFGTQDNPGREKLIEAINSVQEDFQKIIVITHLEELKDVFPVRINVAKTSEGSRVWLS
jgi:exonuclease SbcC